MIIPTIGRRVWYWPSAYDCGNAAQQPASGVMEADAVQPCDAGICYVHGERLVNLTIADHGGFMHRRCGVQLLQEGDEIPIGQAYATWMPYQVGQAKATSST